MRLLFLLTVTITQLTGWQYVLTPPRATPPADATWSRRIQTSRVHELWYRIELPSSLPREPHLVFRSYAAAFDVFVDERHVYAFRDAEANGRLRLHSVPIPPGRHLYVRVPRGTRLPALGGVPLLAAGDDVPLALVRAVTAMLHGGNVEDIAVGAILIVLGIGSVLVSRVRRSANASALLWFGVFAALYGLRLITESSLLLILGASTLQTDFAEAWITYVINVPGWLMARSLAGDGWRGSLRWQIYVFALFAPVAIITSIVTREPNALESVNNALVIAGGLNILLNLFHTRRRHTRELRVVLVGAAIFMLFALVSNLMALSGRSFDETPGFIVLVVCLGYAAVRTFTQGERARVALEGEMATARDIQRAILPTSMPSVAGLTFAARFEPASSVAGDLYDFVATDDSRVGVLVADVAGHGVPAAMIASMVKVAVWSHTRFAHEPATLLRELNTTLRRNVHHNFVTATYLWFDGRSVTVSNAGHAPPVLVRGDTIRDLGPYGVLLGRFGVVTYSSATVPLQPGDRVAAWTDGIVEARNARGEAFGEPRLHALLRGGASPDAIVEEVLRWRTGDADDLTIVVVEVI